MGLTDLNGVPLTKTFGEKVTGADRNADLPAEVLMFKYTLAAAIDILHTLRVETASQEQARLASIAITELETAELWGTKALQQEK